MCVHSQQQIKNQAALTLSPATNAFQGIVESPRCIYGFAGAAPLWHATARSWSLYSLISLWSELPDRGHLQNAWGARYGIIQTGERLIRMRRHALKSCLARSDCLKNMLLLETTAPKGRSDNSPGREPGVWRYASKSPGGAKDPALQAFRPFRALSFHNPNPGLTPGAILFRASGTALFGQSRSEWLPR